MDLLPSRSARRRGWWDFAPARVLLGVGVPFTAAAILWGGLLTLSATWGHVVEVIAVGALGLVYLTAGLISRVDEARLRRLRPAHARRHRNQYQRQHVRGAHAPGRAAMPPTGPVAPERELEPV